MPRLQTKKMDERIRFIGAYYEGLYSMSELCGRFGMTRQDGYKWVRRYEAEGVEGLADRSHAPHHCPHKIQPEVAKALIELRHKHPRWGPITLRGRLASVRPELHLPAASTVGDLLKREGLVQPRRQRSRSGERRGGKLETSRPNQFWTADYKGHFRTLDGKYCYPLTIQDAHTRFVLACEALLSTRFDEAKPVFERTFREHGLPDAIRTDNGSPFASSTPLRLTRLNAWWIKLGIRPDRSRPGCPQDNGRHERMHKELTPTRFPPAADQGAQQLRFDAPAEVYVPSERPMPKRIPKPEYAAHLEVRRVRTTGTIRFRGYEVFVSEVLTGEQLGLEEVDDGVWSVFFYNVMLARFTDRDGKLHP